MSIEKMLAIKSGNAHPHTDEDHWIPLADIMTGLMMMFLMIAVIFMVKVQADAARADQVAVTYDEMRSHIYDDLNKEFARDLPKWGATLDRDLTIRFKEPDVLFATGQDNLKPRFAQILDDFFPRYVRILNDPKYRDSIEEIRIEGHTSSFWNGNASAEEAYFNNMALSQARTRTTLQYVLSRPAVRGERGWLTAHLTANGLSSSKLIRLKNGQEDREASQRVEFRVRTNADARIEQMLKASGR
ncbi:OmpA/MotB family protein [Asticcacaulis solisilvae]|uniref:OmpA/MotB family protein n=1 Tax=Asticcacaulis solisilvae TaxID=1217274 RepID=UPI003FD7D8E4